MQLTCTNSLWIMKRLFYICVYIYIYISAIRNLVCQGHKSFCSKAIADLTVTIPASIYWLIVNSLFQVPDEFWVRTPENIWRLRVNVYFSRVKIWATYFCSLLWFDFISSVKQVGRKQPPALPGRPNKRAEQKNLSEIEDQVGGSYKDQNNKLLLLSHSLGYKRPRALIHSLTF